MLLLIGYTVGKIIYERELSSLEILNNASRENLPLPRHAKAIKQVNIKKVNWNPVSTHHRELAI